MQGPFQETQPRRDQDSVVSVYSMNTIILMLKASQKIFSKKFAQPNNCIYNCNQSVANNMRRDIFQAIADPTRRAILTLLVTGAMTPNAIAGHFDSSRQAV